MEPTAAIFLTCVVNELYDAFRAMTFETAAERKQVGPIVAAAEAFRK
jgi:hypothetical protein